MQKIDRQNAVLALIDAVPVRSQLELAERLNSQGYRVTQASVSRDLDELGVVKINGRYTRQALQTGQTGYGTVRLDTAGDNLIVGKCTSGLASAITVKIDGAGIPEIVGTIAGDDTILIAVKDRDAQRKLMKTISEMFG